MEGSDVTGNPNPNQVFARAVTGMDRRGDPCLHLTDSAGRFLITLYRAPVDFEEALGWAQRLLLSAGLFVSSETSPERVRERKERFP